jgi:hypothetical protein
MASGIPEPNRPTEEIRSRPPGDEPPVREDDKDAQLFYERLEQTGQLVDVDANADVTTLPPRVTHVRYPDGTIERIGFSTSPYSG